MKTHSFYSTFAFILLFASQCVAQSAPVSVGWDPTLAKFEKQPGAIVTDLKNGRAEDVHDIMLASGVRIQQTRDHQGKITVLAVDNSGKGAVLCSWGMYTEVRAEMEACPSAKDKELKTGLDRALARINAFILANSITPVTKKELNKQVHARVQIVKKQVSGLAPDAREKICNSGQLGLGVGMDKVRATFSAEKLTKDVDNLLSIPRPPVINPCL